jgi:hypothetical protein
LDGSKTALQDGDEVSIVPAVAGGWWILKYSRWTQIDLNNYLRSYQIRPSSELFISLFSNSTSKASRAV